jgi:hypothetical protein
MARPRATCPPRRREAENLLYARIAAPIGRNETVGQAAKPHLSSPTDRLPATSIAEKTVPYLPKGQLWERQRQDALRLPRFSKLKFVPTGLFGLCRWAIDPVWTALQKRNFAVAGHPQ